MKTIGLTGGIGSGKSVVAKLLATMGFPVYDCDSEAKRITACSPEIRERLSERFGDKIYQKDVLNKTLLASLVFGNEKNLKFANSIIHPKVWEDFVQWKEQQGDLPFAVIESAILFESGFGTNIDVIVAVLAPLEIRIERVQKREQVNRESVLNRIKNQMSEEERNRKANYVVVNDNKQAILPQIEDILIKLSC